MAVFSKKAIDEMIPDILEQLADDLVGRVHKPPATAAPDADAEQLHLLAWLPGRKPLRPSGGPPQEGPWPASWRYKPALQVHGQLPSWFAVARVQV